MYECGFALLSDWPLCVCLFVTAGFITDPNAGGFTLNTGGDKSTGWRTNLASAPTVTVSASDNSPKNFLVTLTANMQDGDGLMNGDQCLMGYTVDDGTSTTQPDNARVLRVDGSRLQASATYLISLSGSTSYTFKAAFQELGSGNDQCDFSNTNLVVARTSRRRR